MRNWRLQDSLLLDPEVRDHVSQALTSYFEDNFPREQSDVTIWEAHMCVIRGTQMQITARKKMEARRHTKELVDTIFHLESQHKQTQVALVYKELLEARAKLLEILASQHYQTAQWSRGFFYLHANKGGKLLA
ncbi:Hypothetical predicted protein [Pelobates cultripes]|uniref:Uncharacterized protein n=1 Tax=Pelobates cultripes TaxID=61616 RepID=A0AAD1SG13_PELCU|nr:Hypothetical predicted protein [Pelobates cultripes]